jgi:hypothetical protein
MIWTLPRGLAFGRSGGVGVDGSLTGLFLTFHCVPGLCLGREEDGARNCLFLTRSESLVRRWILTCQCVPDATIPPANCRTHVTVVVRTRPVEGNGDPQPAPREPTSTVISAGTGDGICGSMMCLSGRDGRSRPAPPRPDLCRYMLHGNRRSLDSSIQQVP